MVLRKQLLPWCKTHGFHALKQIGVDEVTQFRTTWNDRPISKYKKQERLKGFFRFCVAREWMRTKLREMRDANPQVTWEDVEAEYEKAHPRELTKIEQIHQEFASKVPHPELHGGKRVKNTWAVLEDANIGFLWSGEFWVLA